MKTKNNHKFKKKYGQNFLDDKELLEKIESVISLDKDTSSVLEIGPGRGFLTGMLIDNSKSVTSYEIDDDLIPYLTNKFSSYTNFNLCHEDFMKAKISGDHLKVIANIPYYITSPILQKLIENRDKIDEIYLMVQKEVAQRICSNDDVSILTHSVNFFCESEYLFTVNKEYFTPKPKVDSAFIKLSVRKSDKYEDKIDSKKYFNFLKLAFSNKRKTLVNNLKGYFDKDLLETKINKNIRAEQLSIDDFITLIKELHYDWIWIHFKSR